MEGPRSGKTIKINRDDFTIGRDDSCNLLLDEDGVSRLHCRIESKDGNYTVKDNDSTNGVYVNGTKIAEPRELKQNDTIRIGDNLFLFSSDESKLDSQAVEALAHARDEKVDAAQEETVDEPVKEDAPASEETPDKDDESSEESPPPSPDETQDHKPDADDHGEVELNFDQTKTAMEPASDDGESPGLKALLSGSTGVMVAIVIILLIILLWVLFSPS
jgi:pSer/pThr/pTyr-binding forkhead associated (FHA) protein